MAFAENRSGADVLTILLGELPQSASIFHWDRKRSPLSSLTTCDHPSLMQLASGATAVRISAAALQQIEGPLNHRLRARESTQQAPDSGVRSPELLPQFGRIGGQLYVLYIVRIQLFKQIHLPHCKNLSEGQPPPRSPLGCPTSRGFAQPPPQCLNHSRGEKWRHIPNDRIAEFILMPFGNSIQSRKGQNERSPVALAPGAQVRGPKPRRGD